MTQNFLYIILGATASGKEQLALRCAKFLDAEIISVDSMKVYKHLDIGTAKASIEDRKNIAHHCLDIADPSTYFSTANYLSAAELAIHDIIKRGKKIILSGGTALYYKALLEGLFPGPSASPEIRQELESKIQDYGLDLVYQELAHLDPLSASKIHPSDKRRVIRALEIIKLTGKKLSNLQTQWSGFYDQDKLDSSKPNYRYPCSIIRLCWDRNLLRERIDRRIDKMLHNGLLEEAKWVYQRQGNLSITPLQAVGYKEFFPYFSGEFNLEEAIARLKINTKRLAKSQDTWFKKFPAHQVNAKDFSNIDSLTEHVLSIWQNRVS